MTASEDDAPFIASETSDTSMLCMTAAVGTRRQKTGSGFSSAFRICGKVRRAFDSVLVRPLKMWMRLERDVAELHSMDDRDLRDIRIRGNTIIE